MHHKEGMTVSLADDSRLDALGILRGGVGCSTAYGLPEASVALFLDIAAAGPGGLAKSRVARDLAPDLAAHLLPLELHQLVTWERDNRGRLAYLVLTWKGDEAIAAARPCAPREALVPDARRRLVRSAA